jgi:hypothetical protein
MHKQMMQSQHQGAANTNSNSSVIMHGSKIVTVVKQLMLMAQRVKDVDKVVDAA